VVVLGAKALSDPTLVDPKSMFVTFAGKIFGSAGAVLNWLIALMLIVALILSALNAIMGCARSLHQMSVDGQFPRFFQHTNRHGVPDRSMLFNTTCSLALIFTGGAVEIYSFSNVGYTISFVPVLVGYFLLRKYKPEARRPYRLPEFMKYVALGLAALYFIIWLYGGIVYTGLPNAALGGANTRIYFFLGWVTLLSYLPLYWYRTSVEDKRTGEALAGPEAETPEAPEEPAPATP
jgi:amino acid transporter